MAQSNQEAKIYGKSAIVVDNCSEISRAGFAGDEDPKVVFQSVVGRPRMTTTDGPKQIFVGDDASSKQGVLTLKHPIDHGIITNWEDIEHVRKEALVARALANVFEYSSSFQMNSSNILLNIIAVK